MPGTINFDTKTITFDPVPLKHIYAADWVRVTERLLRHGGQVLITWTFVPNPSESGPFVTMARHEKGRWDWNSDTANQNRRDEEVLAWMDMPKPFSA